MEVKKLVSVLTISTLMTSAKKEALEYVSCNYYPISFKKASLEIRALIDLRIEVNAIALTYIKKLGLRMQKTNIGAQKIDKSILKSYSIIIVDF